MITNEYLLSRIAFLPVKRASWVSCGGMTVPLTTTPKVASMVKFIKATISRPPKKVPQSISSLATDSEPLKWTGVSATDWLKLNGPFGMFRRTGEH